MEDGDLDLDVEVKDSKGRSSMKKIILYVAVALIVLSSIVAGTVLFINNNSDNEEQQGQDEQDVERAKKPIFVPLGDPLVVNFATAGRPKFLQIGLSVKTFDEKLRGKLEQQLPQIKNNLLLVLSGKTPKELLVREGKEQLRQEILSEIKDVMMADAGADSVEDILFTNFVMQ